MQIVGILTHVLTCVLTILANISPEDGLSFKLVILKAIGPFDMVSNEVVQELTPTE